MDERGEIVVDAIDPKGEFINFLDAEVALAAPAAYAMTILGGAASLIVALLMGVLLTRGITVPITRMTSAMAALAKGDTTVEAPGVGRGDEIGAIVVATHDGAPVARDVVGRAVAPAIFIALIAGVVVGAAVIGTIALVTQFIFINVPINLANVIAAAVANPKDIPGLLSFMVHCLLLPEPYAEFDQNMANHFMWILPCEGTRGEFDLVFANILAKPLRLLAPSLARVAAESFDDSSSREWLPQLDLADARLERLGDDGLPGAHGSSNLECGEFSPL